ncbi:hypothetical protein B0H14DRAFT_2494371 [Mycena olivaceomarginata]|nr:hypothetical protein B0H14DRAFT_2391061 [Mycena olivaceomarginata]KAJ7894704.1 hypothetical protein B0H14DRAFT_2496031 [Mycena olivaceomarginata]KAJ7898879.1 hypothetical protein B0H14DRAFT_2494371 [Mycena olivaceomarginata]
MPDTFTWSSKDGYSLVRRILRNTPLPYEPHDDQLEGVCKSLDGIHLVAIAPTGSGKTGYYTIYMLVMLAVIADPTSFVSEQPLQSANMTLLGLDVLAINSQTRSDALRLKNEELWVVARKKPNIILTGPEQLKSAEFEKAVRDKEFCSTVSTGPIDLVPGYVMHLCWGYGS